MHVSMHKAFDAAQRMADVCMLDGQTGYLAYVGCRPLQKPPTIGEGLAVGDGDDNEGGSGPGRRVAWQMKATGWSEDGEWRGVGQAGRRLVGLEIDRGSD